MVKVTMGGDSGRRSLPLLRHAPPAEVPGGELTYMSKAEEANPYTQWSGGYNHEATQEIFGNDALMGLSRAFNLSYIEDPKTGELHPTDREAGLPGEVYIQKGDGTKIPLSDLEGFE